jgi:hypothetical protein
MLEDVVVAWNGSPRARAALEWALRRRATRTVRLLGVLPDGADGDAGLEAEVDRVRAERPDLAVSGEAVPGDVERALLLAAVPGTLLVLGTGGPEGGLPASADLLARVARRAVGPVALVPISGGDPAGPVAAGVDSTAAGAAAAQLAAAEASAEGRSVVTVHVHGDEVPAGRAVPSPDEAARELAAHFPHLLVRRRTVHGDVHLELLRSAAVASLIVLGRHERPGRGAELERDALIGSSCPVLLVRASDALWRPG